MGHGLLEPFPSPPPFPCSHSSSSCAGSCVEDPCHVESICNGYGGLHIYCPALELHWGLSQKLPPHPLLLQHHQTPPSPHLLRFQRTSWASSFLWPSGVQIHFLDVIPVDETASVSYTEPFDSSQNLPCDDLLVTPGRRQRCEATWLPLPPLLPMGAGLGVCSAYGRGCGGWWVLSSLLRVARKVTGASCSRGASSWGMMVTAPGHPIVGLLGCFGLSGVRSLLPLPMKQMKPLLVLFHRFRTMCL